MKWYDWAMPRKNQSVRMRKSGIETQDKLTQLKLQHQHTKTSKVPQIKSNAESKE